MNIAQAKQQISNAMKAYFCKDEYGNFRIPVEEQRPVFLMGPPGIGKTAIMKQIADEMGVSLVSYSMTHHTRQSALGLPVIAQKMYDGREQMVTEYTMSEIIASVYDTMEAAGGREGILFLDEINCVSETLTPTMLQFLQYKTFGKHQVPQGWIVVTAGNPTEYNRSAREFDVVTWDRLKRMDIEPDFEAWKQYALQKGIHPSVVTYLEAKKGNFYVVNTTVDGKQFVTARGWADLAEMITVYESQQIPVDRELIAQYIQVPDVAEDFAIYYDLFNKYKSDYQVPSILDGSAGKEIYDRAAAASFDERLSLLSLLLDGVASQIRSVMEQEDKITGLLTELKLVKGGDTVEAAYERVAARQQRDERRGVLSSEKRRCYGGMLAFLKKQIREGADFGQIKAEYDKEVAAMKQNAAWCSQMLAHLFQFAESVWPEGQELLLLVTEMTVHSHMARFIARYGCDAYYRHNRELMFYERQTEIIRQLEALEEGELTIVS